MPLDTLRALGTGNEPPAEAKERVAGALFAALDSAAVATGAAAIAEHSLANASVRPMAGSLLGGVAGSKLLAVAAGIWLAGGITGAALYRGLRPEEVRVVYVDRAVAQVAPSALSAPPMVSANAGCGAACTGCSDRHNSSAFGQRRESPRGTAECQLGAGRLGARARARLARRRTCRCGTRRARAGACRRGPTSPAISARAAYRGARSARYPRLALARSHG